MKVYFTGQCQTCNPNDPVLYEDPKERDYETQCHADLTGHTVHVGVTIK